MRKVEVGRSVEILLKFEIFLFLNPLNTQNKHVSEKVVRGALGLGRFAGQRGFAGVLLAC